MQQSLWLPFWVGLGLIATSLPLILLLPQARSHAEKKEESIHSRTSHVGISETSPLLAEEEPESSNLEEDELSQPPETVKAKSVMGTIKSVMSDYLALIASRRDFQLLLAAFCLAGLSNSALGLLLVYISKRYQWPFARVCFAHLNALCSR